MASPDLTLPDLTARASKVLGKC